MWRSLWRSTDRFSVQRLRYLANELKDIKFVDKLNREFVVSILRSMVEIITYGDRHDMSIFECFMESQILSEFLRILHISRNSGIEASLLHHLSIMIQNLTSEHAIYYCFSNEYINDIILHQYEFDALDLAHYYVSFLRTVSGKLNRDTIQLLVKVHEDVVVSFPLYSEALKFSHHEERMIQIAVRALILKIYNVSDDMVFTFITSPPASEYFSDLVLNLRKQCLHLDALVSSSESYNYEVRTELHLETDKLMDDIYYCSDIIQVGQSRLRTLVTKCLLKLLILPILLPSLQLSSTLGSHLSAITSLYILCRLLQVIDGKELANSVAVALLYPYMALHGRSDADKGGTDGTLPASSYTDSLNEMGDMDIFTHDPERDTNVNMSNLFGHLSSSSDSHYVRSDSHYVRYPQDDARYERTGIPSLIFSGNHNLMLASLTFLIVLSERKDLDYLLSSVVGFAGNKSGMKQSTILTALLKILGSQPPLSVVTQWKTGWVLRQLLKCQEQKLTDHDINLFNTSLKQSIERLLKELNGCWFDHMPIALKSEWGKCKRVLEESSWLRDPFFSLELSFQKHIPDGDMSSSLAWHRMVDAVKSFVLHLQLEAFIFKSDSLENHLRQLRSGSVGTSRRNHDVDVLSATYGTHLHLGSGIRCKIAFSKLEHKDVYLVPVAMCISGKLLLVEKLPHSAHQGVVIAIAPLAGLSPKIDEDHPAWLDLCIRDSDPVVHESKASVCYHNGSDKVVDRRWTLGFPNAEVCQAALSVILNETIKQRSLVKSLISPLLQNNSFKKLPVDQGE